MVISSDFESECSGFESLLALLRIHFIIIDIYFAWLSFFFSFFLISINRSGPRASFKMSSISYVRSPCTTISFEFALVEHANCFANVFANAFISISCASSPAIEVICFFLLLDVIVTTICPPPFIFSVLTFFGFLYS
eukprot:NODE_1_length_95616_cov_0.657642.p69 type:complete len:137 gc:universal NODE_1_length_95616_cov_0.657642:85141-85551(+)